MTDDAEADTSKKGAGKDAKGKNKSKDKDGDDKNEDEVDGGGESWQRARSLYQNLRGLFIRLRHRKKYTHGIRDKNISIIELWLIYSFMNKCNIKLLVFEMEFYWVAYIEISVRFLKIVSAHYFKFKHEYRKYVRVMYYTRIPLSQVTIMMKPTKLQMAKKTTKGLKLTENRAQQNERKWLFLQ